MPNEASSTFEHLHVVANTAGHVIIKILDIQGRMAKRVTQKVQQGTHKLSLYLDDLANGIYVANVFLGDKFLSAVRLVKN